MTDAELNARHADWLAAFVANCGPGATATLGNPDPEDWPMAELGQLWLEFEVLDPDGEGWGGATIIHASDLDAPPEPLDLVWEDAEDEGGVPA